MAALIDEFPVLSTSSPADEADIGLSQLFDSAAQTYRKPYGDTDDHPLDLRVCMNGVNLMVRLATGSEFL